MRLEDALLQICFDAGSLGIDEIATVCTCAVSCGVDAIRLGRSGDSGAMREMNQCVLDVCRRDDALCIVDGDCELCADLGADGVHLMPGDVGYGHARAIVGEGTIVGMCTETTDQIILAVELGVNYLIHQSGNRCRMDFMSVGRGGASFLFAGGFQGIDEAREITDDGVFRLAVDVRETGIEDLSEMLKEYSRLLGRSI